MQSWVTARHQPDPDDRPPLWLARDHRRPALRVTRVFPRGRRSSARGGPKWPADHVREGMGPECRNLGRKILRGSSVRARSLYIRPLQLPRLGATPKHRPISATTIPEMR